MSSREFFKITLRAGLGVAAVSLLSSNSLGGTLKNTECGKLAPKSRSVTHIVKSGETLSSILFAQGHRKLWCGECAVAEASQLNNLSDPSHLRIGDTIALQSCISADVACAEGQSRQSQARVTASEELPNAEPPTAETESHAVAAQPITPSVKEPAHRSELLFAVPLHTFEIQGTDRADSSHGTIQSGSNPGVLLSWRLRFTTAWSTELVSRFEFDAVQPDINSVNIEGREQKITDVEAHLRYGQGLRLSLDLKSRDRLVYRAATGSGIRVQTLPSRSAGLSIDSNLAQFGASTLRGGISYEALLADTNTGLGSAYAGRLNLRHDFESWAVESEVGYEFSRYQTTLLELVENDLWLAWGVVWKL